MSEETPTPDPDKVAKAAAKRAEPKKASPPTAEPAAAEDVAKASAKAAQPRKAQEGDTAVPEAQTETAIEKALKKLKRDGFVVRTDSVSLDATPVSGAYGAIGESPSADAEPASAGTVRVGAQNG